MSLNDSPALEPQLFTRRESYAELEPQPAPRKWRRRLLLSGTILMLVLLIAGAIGFFYAKHWVRAAATDSLPQIDGSLAVSGLAAPVTVQRDAQGVPHIHAASLDDLVFAQGFVTAQDRLFQMDLLRRHAAGELAEILGLSVIGHDRLQRTLQVRAAAERALAQTPPDQLHLLERYAAGVNASIAVQSAHLPIEFRVLRYQPALWTPRDSLLVALVMFEDLTNAFPSKLARESLVAQLPSDQRTQLEQDLYPVGSWRDHPPAMPIPDLTIEGPPIEDVPLDESQSRLEPHNLGAPHLDSEMWGSGATSSSILEALRPMLSADCLACTPGSNDWVVSGAHTASGKPLLSNDMHLNHALPGIWYEADLEASTAVPFHAAGVSLPGVPLIVVGHNDHIAWGFTNLGADVQDVYIENLRGTGSSQEFQATDGSWQPVVHLPEPIKVKGGKDQAFEVLATRHGNTLTPILNPALTKDVTEPNGHARTLALRWTIYDPGAVSIPTLAVDTAHDWPSFLAAFRDWGGPAQNVVYADDQGHIGYHAMGKIPLRGPAQNPPPEAPLLEEMQSSQLSPTIHAVPETLDEDNPPPTPTPLLSGPLSDVPLIPSAAHEWTGYIPFDSLPQVFDPPGGVIATANARTAPDDYAYPITLNWAAPYRNERIWRLLAHSNGLRPSDMLAIQSDVYSDFDRMLAERLTYALDHATKTRTPTETKTLHQAADLLRVFKGRMTVDSAAASIVSATHSMLWPMLLEPKLVPKKKLEDINGLYQWGERDYALEEILMHTPPRWLPAGYTDWNDFLASAVLAALKRDKAPADLASWRYGAHHTVDIEHPIFDQSEALRYFIGVPTGTGSQPQSGDGTTVKQVGHTFGPSERFTADLADLDHSTLNIVVGQSGNPMSPWFRDQFSAWLRGTTFPLHAPPTHTLTLQPR